MEGGDIDPNVCCEEFRCLDNCVGRGYGARSESLDHAVVTRLAFKRVWNLTYQIVASLRGQYCAGGGEAYCKGNNEDKFRVFGGESCCSGVVAVSFRFLLFPESESAWPEHLVTKHRQYCGNKREGDEQCDGYAHHHRDAN